MQFLNKKTGNVVTAQMKMPYMMEVSISIDNILRKVFIKYIKVIHVSVRMTSL